MAVIGSDADDTDRRSRLRYPTTTGHLLRAGHRGVRRGREGPRHAARYVRRGRGRRAVEHALRADQPDEQGDPGRDPALAALHLRRGGDLRRIRRDSRPRESAAVSASCAALTADRGRSRRSRRGESPTSPRPASAQCAAPFIGKLNNQRVRKALNGAINGFLTGMVADEALDRYELSVTATRAGRDRRPRDGQRDHAADVLDHVHPRHPDPE